MQLTTFADLGLRVLMVLGATQAVGAADRSPVRIQDLADQLNASRNHVAKVVNMLASDGLLESIRGRHGGMHITEQGMRASVGALLRQLEDNREVVDCEGALQCPLARHDCALRHRLAAAQEAFFATLDGDTVGDLVSATKGLAAGASGGPVPLGAPTLKARPTI